MSALHIPATVIGHGRSSNVFVEAGIRVSQLNPTARNRSMAASQNRWEMLYQGRSVLGATDSRRARKVIHCIVIPLKRLLHNFVIHHPKIRWYEHHLGSRTIWLALELLVLDNHEAVTASSDHQRFETTKHATFNTQPPKPRPRPTNCGEGERRARRQRRRQTRKQVQTQGQIAHHGNAKLIWSHIC